MARSDFKDISNCLINLAEAIDKNQEKINSIVNIAEMLTTINANLTLVKDDLKQMDTKITGMKTDIDGMKTDIDGMKTDINCIQTGMARIREDIVQIEEKSITRAYNSHLLSPESIIRWIPNGNRPAGFPATIDKLQNASEATIHNIMAHYGLGEDRLTEPQKLRLIKQFLGLPVV